MAFLTARWKQTVSVKAPTKAEPTEPGNLPMGSVKAQMAAAPTEPGSLPMGSEKVQTMEETTEAENLPKVLAKAQTKGSLKAALTLTVTEKASRKEPLKEDRSRKGPGKTMAFLTARGKQTVSVKAPTKAEPTEPENLPMGFVKAQMMAEPTDAESRSMGSEKVQTMEETTEAENPPKLLAKAQTKGSLKAALTSTVTEKASRMHIRRCGRSG